MTVVKFLYSIVAIVAFPCILFPIRESINKWFYLNINTKRGYGFSVLIGVVILLTTLVISIFVPNID